jgi:hypothetical protein
MTLWCKMGSAKDYRDTSCYEAPHQIGQGHPRQRLDDMDGPLSTSETTARATAVG